jgi:hypothetical protein
MLRSNIPRQSSDDSELVIKKHKTRSSNSVQLDSIYIEELEDKIESLSQTLDITESKLDTATTLLNATKLELNTAIQKYNYILTSYKKHIITIKNKKYKIRICLLCNFLLVFIMFVVSLLDIFWSRKPQNTILHQCT